MSWARSQDLYLAITAPVGQQLVRGAGNLSPVERPIFIFGDKFPVRLLLIQAGDNGVGSTPVLLDPTDIINLAGSIDTSADTILFLATGFTNVGDDTNPVYQAVLDLNTEELLAALGNDDSLLVNVDVEIKNAANTQRRTLRFQASILQQVFEGDEPPPVSIPDYPDAASIALKAPANGTYRIKTTVDGTFLQLIDVATGKFRSIWFNAGVLQIGPEEV
jgi:hypothetical protein